VARLTARERRWLLGAGLLYAAIVIPIGIRKGGDFTQELGVSERLLRGLPPYAANPEGGIWWPPFTALALVPFALVARWSLALAQAGWSVLNVCCLGWAVVRARGWADGWVPLVVAVAAVAKPLQSNFEHLNLTPMLLGLIVATAADLEARRDARAGVWIGLATALKGFPALLLLYCALRRRWQAVAVGLVLAGGLTLGAMLPYGPGGAVRAVLAWLHLTREGAMLTHYGTQSLPGFAFFFGWPAALVGAVEVACGAAVLVALQRPTTADATLSEVGLVTLLAVLVSPIAWLYYYTLAFPGWVAVLGRPGPSAPPRRALLIVAGVLTSGVLTFGLYPRFAWFVGDANYTWGGLALLTLLVLKRLRPPQGTPDELGATSG
jgi:hypothetical protein